MKPVKIRTVYGDFIYVSETELTNANRTHLTMYTAKGDVKQVNGWSKIHRNNLIHGEVQTPDIVVLEDSMRKTGWKIARFPRTEKTQNKLLSQGYLPYLRGEDGKPAVDRFGLIWAKKD